MAEFGTADAPPPAAREEEPPVPCNYEFEKAVFFRKLSPDTTDAAIRALLETHGPVDYCYVAREEDGASKRLGRAKFRAVAAAEDAALASVAGRPRVFFIDELRSVRCEAPTAAASGGGGAASSSSSSGSLSLGFFRLLNEWGSRNKKKFSLPQD